MGRFGPNPRENGPGAAPAWRPACGSRPGRAARADPAAAQRPGRQPAHIAVVRGRAAGAARPVQSPGTGDRHLPAVLQNGVRRGRVTERGGEARGKTGAGDGSSRKDDVNRRGRKDLERPARGCDPHPRVLSERLLQPLPDGVSSAPRRHPDTERDVVGRVE